MKAAFLLPALLLAAVSASSESLTVTPGCQASCGGVDIPYPFGIGTGCFRKGFEISCVNNGSAGPMPVLAATSQTTKVLQLSVWPRPEARVMLPVAWQCFNSTGGITGDFNGKVNINADGVYRISNTLNELVILGCNTFAYIKSGESGGGRYSYTYYTGCVAYSNDSRSAQDGACAGVGCCHVDIPPGLTDNVVSFYSGSGWSHADQEFCPCDYAFIVDRDYYTFRTADLHMDVNRTMPLWLDWAIRDNNSGSAVPMSCAAAAKNPGYACVSAHSECVDSTNGPGYSCNCTKGYEGNAYVVNGCTNIDECASPAEYPCYGVCKDTQGSYDCKCRPGYQSNDAKTERCTPKFPLAAQLSIGITLGISFLAIALLSTLLMLQKRRMNEFFKKNGGLILQNVETLKIFSKEELKKITKNHSEVLGKGAFGQVYKGILPDSTMVAVKTSIEVNEARKEEFTKEVEIQSKMIHKNIIKLLGCCLEVDVPVLVYEFAANGSLQDILHGKTSIQPPLPLDLRLDIAIEAAEGLTYMHSSTSRTIRHGDVKPANILLDDKYMPKISDFGTSKLLTVDKDCTMLVVGSMGYIDPVFHKTGHLTQKSDVYSFGVVLLELITRKPIVYDGSRSLIIEFLKVHEQEKSGRAMFDTEIATEEDVFILEEIGRLAVQCLKEKVEERPEMKEVAERLVMLRRARKRGETNYTSSYHFEEINVDGAPKSFASEISKTGGDTLPQI